VPARIHYDVSCLAPNTHYFDITLTVERADEGPLRLSMPAWTPGAYKVENYAGRVHAEHFEDGSGRKLAFTKPDKSTWEVARAGKTVVAKYKVFGLDLGIHRSYLDDARAVVNGNSVFMGAVGHEGETIEVRFRIPNGWKRIETGLEPVRGRPDSFRAADYDELIDCPVFMGNPVVETFKVRGVPHRLVMEGPGNYDLAQLVEDTRKIVESAAEVFGGLPYKHYTFLCELSPDRFNGLEHRNSTHMIFPRWTWQPRKDYVIALSLISHEFFHTWNVKRLRPAGLGPFDYSKETYTPLLWFAEGFTSYYDLLLLRRAGCISPREFLDEVGREIRRLKMTPGRLVHSLEDSSRDAWIKLYQGHADSPNTTISYYNKGSLFGMALDLTLRDATRGKKSLDDVMRLLYQRFYEKDDRGFDPKDVEDACREVAGKSQKAVFDLIVRGTAEVDWARYLELAGLELASKQEPTAPEKLRHGDVSKRKAYLGIKLSSGKPAVVGNVLTDGPAAEAGICAGDELIAMDDQRVDDGRIEKLLAFWGPGKRVKITLARAGVMQERELTLAQRPVHDFSIQPRARAAALQQTVCRGWVGETWKALDRPSSGFDFRPSEKIY